VINEIKGFLVSQKGYNLTKKYAHSLPGALKSDIWADFIRNYSAYTQRNVAVMNEDIKGSHLISANNHEN
jgi:hypothetical protein